MNDADSKKLEEIEEKYTIDEGNGPFICIVGAEETNDDMAWLIAKVKEQDRQLEELLNNAVPDKKWDKVFHGSVVDYLRHRAAHFIKNYHEPERGARR